MLPGGTGPARQVSSATPRSQLHERVSKKAGTLFGPDSDVPGLIVEALV